MAKKPNNITWKMLDNATEEEIVEYLRKKRIKGIPGDPVECPLAVLFGANSKNYGDWYICGTERAPIGNPVKHSKSVRAFIRHFDAGMYPELEKSC